MNQASAELPGLLNEMNMVCVRCKVEKKSDQFRIKQSGERDRLCLNCHGEKLEKENYYPGEKKRRKKHAKNHKYRKKYGVSFEWKKSKYEEQNGKCASCLRAFPIEEICVDHDHHTGCVRDLLCHACNYMLGKMHESIDEVRSAFPLIYSGLITYIGKWRSESTGTGRPLMMLQTEKAEINKGQNSRLEETIGMPSRDLSFHKRSSLGNNFHIDGSRCSCNESY